MLVERARPCSAKPQRRLPLPSQGPLLRHTSLTSPHSLPGALSDASFSRYRRRAFIASSSVGVIVSTLFVAYARELAALFASLSGLGDWDPEQDEKIKSIAIFIGVVGFYVLDFSLNGLQASLRVSLFDLRPFPVLPSTHLPCFFCE